MGLLAGAGLTALLGPRADVEPVPRPPAVQAAPAPASPPGAPAVASGAPDRPPEGGSTLPSEPAVELPWELEEIARRYRSAESDEQRTDALLEIGLSDDPSALAFLLEELERAAPSQREVILPGVIQFGSRDAVPRLRALASTANSAQERRALEEAADYLALPSLSELRRGELDLGD